MKIAIVGSSEIDQEEENHVRQYCIEILVNHKQEDTTIISGGAKGVDSIALE